MTKEELMTRIQNIRDELNRLEADLLNSKENDVIFDINKNETVEQTVKRYLRWLSAPTNMKGYHYFAEAVEMVVEDPKAMRRLVKHVYPTIAEKHDDTPHNVEKMIRHYVETIWHRAEKEKVSQIFGKTVSKKTGIPTISQAISSMVEYYKMFNQ